MNSPYLLIGFQAAYDTIKKDTLYAAMKEFGFLGKLMIMVQLLMKNSSSSVRVQSSLSA